MYSLLQVISILVVAVTMAQALAHLLELPGKLRLPRETYLQVQQIYYPGFTIGGACEPIAIVALLALTLLTVPGGAAFWLTLIALVALALMHAIYWILIHPVNNFWLRNVDLKGLGASFFSVATGAAAAPDWTALRSRWEYSHAVRAVLGLLSLTCLAAAVVAR